MPWFCTTGLDLLGQLPPRHDLLDEAGEPLSNQAVWDRTIIMEVPRG